MKQMDAQKGNSSREDEGHQINKRWSRIEDVKRLNKWSANTLLQELQMDISNLTGSRLSCQTRIAYPLQLPILPSIIGNLWKHLVLALLESKLILTQSWTPSCEQQLMFSRSFSPPYEEIDHTFDLGKVCVTTVCDRLCRGILGLGTRVSSKSRTSLGLSARTSPKSIPRGIKGLTNWEK